MPPQVLIMKSVLVAQLYFVFCTVEKTGSRSYDARIEVGHMKLPFLRSEAVSCRIILPQFDARLE